ncbi:MAG: UvrD-helicase domain-containing protein [Patescibacteria group bacterium]|jgi:DNA helicase-2/ATP-dependent DNA helicase PcrA
MTEKMILNEDQKKAVTHKKGPLLVVAGAGTGKTRVITERIRHLVQKGKVNPQNILALTFTEKASQEMLGRVDEVMPLGYEDPWVYTFHSFADRVLRAEGLEVGLDTSYKILSYPEQWLLFRNNLYSFDLKYFRPLGNPTKFISAILKFISRLQDENILSADFSAFVEKKYKGTEEYDKWFELANVYRKYTDLKIQDSRMDFGDLIVWAIKLFRERPNILEKYQHQFKHVLVDEFQDTNYAQYELVKLLCPVEMGSRSLLVVGDDSQSIYKFRGAAISNILEFRKDYPECEMITLLRNYRSHQKILDSSYKLIENNNPDSLESKLGISKKLVSEVDTPAVAPEVYLLEDLDTEVDLVITKILELLAREPQYTYKDIAILSRANSHLDPFVLALRKVGLPYQLVGNRGLYDREEVRDLLAFLRVIVNPYDSLSLYRVLNIDVLEISQDVIASLLSTAKYRKVAMWEVVKESHDEKMSEFVKTLGYFADRIVKATPVELVYELVNTTGLLNRFVQEETIENNLSVRNLDLFLGKVKEFEVEFRNDSKEIPTLINFLDFIDLMIEAGDNPAQAEIEDVDTINLLTVHASKGLEFPVVFMVNLVSDRFPTRNRSDVIEIPDDLIKEVLPEGDAHIQEERRLFYVGMTRAQKYLFLLSAKNYGGTRDKRPSGYIEETGIKTQELGSEEVAKMNSQKGLFGLGTEFREPKVGKITDFTPKFLSYTQISAYDMCPLKYKYTYILNIPTAPSHALSFGITIHDTLRDFHSKLMFGEVSLDDLYKIYEKNWQPLGYMGEDHRKHTFDEGKRILKDYYERLDPKEKTLGLEKSFNIKIDGIKFFGRIDRIVELDGGVEIIDYKTGEEKDQKEVDKDDQMDFYAMAAREAFGLEPKKLTFYFLEKSKKISTTRDQAQLAEKKEEVIKTVGEIKKGAFDPKPGMMCTWCDYKEICPFAWRG